MKTLGVVRKNAYFDSVTLMGISKRLHDVPGVVRVSVSMGTDMNKEVLVSGGFDLDSVVDAGPNDLMIACAYEDDHEEEEMLACIEDMITVKHQTQEEDAEAPKTLDAACSTHDANIAIISVPGIYAAHEARKALDLGLHVMMFSDNVTIEDEVELKKRAHDKGLLMMGPDCGTAIIQDAPLCFANKVLKGSVGMVSASGTGSQELSVLLTEAGIGISQLIGTGGRDLSEQVGGIMFLDALSMLERDEGTTHIVVVSKPPHASVMRTVQERIEHASKPVVACFLGRGDLVDAGSAAYASTLEEAARRMTLMVDPDATLDTTSTRYVGEPPTGSFVRGLFCGGTLMEEAKQIFIGEMPQADVFSNAAKAGARQLADLQVSEAHTFLDMGDDAFTKGKPHPMIDPEMRNDRIVAEAADPETGVIVLDFVLGYGSHEDPVGVTLPAIREANRIAAESGRSVAIVAYVLGTDEDPQDKKLQCARLVDEGVVVCSSNASAARMAASIIKEVQ